MQSVTKKINPSQIVLLSFAAIILVGTVLLMLPKAVNPGQDPLSFVDALFTATSATCVTGLIVKDTPVYFSRFGQLIILFLIQVGGLGIMTFSVLFVFLSGKKMSLAYQSTLGEIFDFSHGNKVVTLIKRIFQLTIIIEFLGFVLLYISFDAHNVTSPAYTAFFHSISAFCNAGFSTFSDSLMQFSHTASINLIISTLIILGGLGFVVILNIIYSVPRIIKRPNFPVVSLQSKMAVLGTVVLILAGAVFFFFFQSQYFIDQGFSLKEKLLSSFFQSVTTRTAGFNTIDISQCSNSNIILMIFLMFIGACPGGTGGGIKITTFIVIIALLISILKNEQKATLFKRTISNEIIHKSICIMSLFSFSAIIILCSLCYTENLSIRDLAFETFSALGTVGLSTGITGKLSVAGRYLIIIAMFFGRLGPLSIVLALGKQQKESFFSYPEEKVMVG